jgi:uncharacterized small protein (DUF1192 family)
MPTVADLAKKHAGCGASSCLQRRESLPAEGVFPECITVEAVRRVEELTEAVAALRSELSTLKAGLGINSAPRPPATPARSVPPPAVVDGG